MKFFVKYGVGGGYDDISAEIVDVDSQEEADRYAYEASINVYQMYDIFYSQNDEEELAEMSEEELEDAELEDMESWISYSAELYVPEKHDEILEAYS